MYNFSPIRLVSGKVPEQPVVSVKSGNVYEKRLIEQWLESNDNIEPTTKQQISKEDLVEVKGTQKKLIYTY
jgi:pre-mRNA-processing factor 19